jgi:SAM-dependent methyltransferase
MTDISRHELARLYNYRFEPRVEYRQRVWRVLVERYFQPLVPETGALLDLGCGYGEFVNQVKARVRLGMDLNANAKGHLEPEVRFIQQDCSARWPLGDGELDVVFTSNFLEHLPDRVALGRTLDEAGRCLKPGGRLIALGPNIRYTHGRYWDFLDHHLPLTEASLSEGLLARAFEIERCFSRFLPYTMVGGPQYPDWVIAAYLRLPWLWRLTGQQFLVVARKAAGDFRATTGK